MGTKNLSLGFALIMGSLGLTACGSSGGSNNDGVMKTSADYNRAQTVCQPMTGSTTSTQSQSTDPLPYTSMFDNELLGLQGRLYYLSPSQPRFGDVADYINQGIDSGMDVFLNRPWVPTRMFTEGFPAADGTLLAVNGQTLTEYFGMFLESEIQLTASDAPGQYQLAILADDGTILDLRAPTGDFYQFINDDGTHPTQMACATQPLTINTYDRIPMQLSYYQGPRYQIALMMMWRPWPKDPSQVNDPMCGQNGNYLFFDPSTTPSTPEPAYNGLLSRGWKPMQIGNFVIPGQGNINPCNDPGFWQ